MTSRDELAFDTSIVVETLDVKGELLRPKLDAMIFAEWAAVTKENKPVVSGIFDSFNIPSGNFPAEVPFYIYFRTSQAYQYDINIVIFSPNGLGYAKLMFPANKQYQPVVDSANIIQHVSALKLIFMSAGMHWFQVRYGDEILGNVALSVLELKTDN